MRARLITAVLLVAALAAGVAFYLFSSDPEQPTATITEPTQEPSPTPEPSPSATSSPTPTAEPAEVPTPNTTGEDFLHVMEEITAFTNLLMERPNPDRVEDVLAPSCVCHDRILEVVTELSENGWRHEVGTLRLIDARLVDRPGPDIAHVAVTNEQLPSRVVDDDGQVIESGGGFSEARWAYTLIRNEADRWRVADVALVEGG